MIAHGPSRRRATRIKRPFPPMEAQLVNEIPIGSQWQYEPKWDGFRCLAFRSGDEIELQSKAGQPLTRYFPDVVEALRQIRAKSFVLDGEIVVPIKGALSFDDLLMRIHPAKSRVEKLARETPAMFLAFDLLRDGPDDLIDLPLAQRRKELEQFARSFFPKAGRARLSPATRRLAKARSWFKSARSGGGLDGIVAKDVTMTYRSGERIGMQKVKHVRTADCVVGGYRVASKKRALGSLLLGLYDSSGVLHHVGFTSSFTNAQRQEILKAVHRLRKPASEGGGFTGRSPGGPSRWSTERSGQWEPIAPKIVVEVQWDHFTGDRFRHGTKFLRWRPDKAPHQCTMDQVQSGGRTALRILE